MVAKNAYQTCYCMQHVIQIVHIEFSDGTTFFLTLDNSSSYLLWLSSPKLLNSLLYV